MPAFCERGSCLLYTSYIRLMSHLYYMAVRAKTGEAVNVDLNDFVKNKYPKALKIAEQICGNMETALQKKLLPEETGFLAIHIQRMIAS